MSAAIGTNYRQKARLYEVTDRLGTMKSKGPLDPGKQALFDEYKAEKVTLLRRQALGTVPRDIFRVRLTPNTHRLSFGSRAPVA